MDYFIYGVPMLAVIIGLTETIKRLGMPSRFAPLVSIFWGLLFFVLLPIGIPFPIGNGIVKGITAGLLASGLWDIGKKSILNK